MKSKKFVFIVIATSLFFASCGGLGKAHKVDEGTIEYDVTFPFNQDDVLINLFPEKMNLSFDSHNMKAELRSLGGIVTSEFYVDIENREFSQILKSFSDKHAMHLDQSGVDDMLSHMPQMILTPTDETDTLAGFLCKKTIAEFSTDSLPVIVLWHTDQIAMDTPNWWNQFNGCDEVLLGYEIEQYGMRMRLRATSVVEKEIPNSVFKLPEGYTELSWSGMENKIQGLLDDFRGEHSNADTTQ